MNENEQTEELLKINEHLKERRALFDERDDMKWLCTKFSKMVYAFVFGVAIVVTFILEGRINYSNELAVLISQPLPEVNFLVFLQYFLIAAAIGIAVAIAMSRHKKKRQCDELEESIRQDYKNTAYQVISYELYHPYTVSRLVKLVENGLSILEAENELKKDCEVKKLAFNIYASVESLIDRGKAERR